MLSAFKYRLHPRPEQKKRLNRSLLLLCDLYNDLKAEEMRRHREEHKSTSLTRFRRLALSARKLNKDLQTIHSQVVQNVGDRVHRSFRNFFEGRARFPRWKKTHKYNSLTYRQSGFNLTPKKGLYLSGMGYVKIFVHRPLRGKVKRLTVKREADCWYAAFVTEREPPLRKPLSEIPTARVRGADMGLNDFATFDDASSVRYPPIPSPVGGQNQAPPAAPLEEAQGLQAPSRTRPQARQAPLARPAPARRLPEQARPQDIHR